MDLVHNNQTEQLVEILNLYGGFLNHGSLFDYLNHYIKNTKPSKKINQRLSYYGFDMVFLTTVCAAGFPGYYYPDIESVHEDAGEELAIFCKNRHEIVYKFLLSIGVDANIALSDAEGIEHHVSIETLKALEKSINK